MSTISSSPPELIYKNSAGTVLVRWVRNGLIRKTRPPITNQKSIAGKKPGSGKKIVNTVVPQPDMLSQRYLMDLAGSQSDNSITGISQVEATFTSNNDVVAADSGLVTQTLGLIFTVTVPAAVPGGAAVTEDVRLEVTSRRRRRSMVPNSQVESMIGILAVMLSGSGADGPNNEPVATRFLADSSAPVI